MTTAEPGTMRPRALRCKLSRRPLPASNRRKRSSARELSMKLARKRSARLRSAVRKKSVRELLKKRLSVRDRRMLMHSVCVMHMRLRCASKSRLDSNS